MGGEGCICLVNGHEEELVRERKEEEKLGVEEATVTKAPKLEGD